MKTIKQIADEIGVSKQAIRNQIEKLGLQSKLKKNANQYEINAKQENLIKQAFLHKYKEKSSFENAKQTQSESESLHQFTLRILEHEIEFLRVQLKAKDEQLERLDKRLAEAQILHADTKKMPLLNSVEAEVSEPPMGESEAMAAGLGERLKFLFSGKLQ